MILLLIFLALALTLAINAASQDRTGCCCKDGRAYKGSFTRESVCTAEAAGYTFMTPPASFIIGRRTSTICIDYCAETAAAPEVVIAECGSADYVPGAQNIQAKPVKGQRKIGLTWRNNCTDYISYYEVARCSGECRTEDFRVMATVANFTDQTAIEWDKSYTYKIKTVFTFDKASEEKTISATAGNLECQNQGINAFCISPYYYYGFKEYLQTYGYKTEDKNKFSSSLFNSTRDQIFGGNYNNAFRCDDYNQLNPILSCPSGKVCIASGTTANCADKIECRQQASTTPFGLYAMQDNCEGTATKKYCYYDKSFSVVNDCFDCDIRMTCYDYRTKNACERNNCGIGSCEWHDTFPLLGLGVCIDTRFDNCLLCNKTGNFNTEAYNAIFDRCTPTKAKALETAKNPCFYDPATSSGKGCSNIGCMDYISTAQCGAPQTGIQLDANNKLIQKSADPCRIGVCQYNDVTSTCAKNANGRVDETTFMDCYKFYRTGDYKDSRAVKECELDYFPPETEFIPASKKIGITDYFMIRIKDKKSFTTDYAYISKAQRQDHPTYFCISSGNATCRNFTQTTTDMLVVDNLILGEKTTRDVLAIAMLTEGRNKIRYYSEDINRNLEEMKEISFNACSACQGPTLLEINFSDAREIEGVYYTSNGMPSLGLLFSTATTITTKEIIGMNRILGTTAATTNNKYHTLTAATGLSEGSYKFRIDGVNSQNIAMESAVDIPFVYDTTSPTARILVEDKPAGGEVYEKSNVKLKIEFSEPVIVEQILVAKPDIGEYMVFEDIENITETLTTKDNIIYTATLTLPDGPNQIRLHALDYAKNPIFDAATFYISTSAPQIILKSPSYGVSATPHFDLVVETTGPANCRFWFNAETPVIPAPVDYALLEEFTITGKMRHAKDGINRIQADKEKQPYPLAVKCRNKYGEVAKIFSIKFDKTLPQILNAAVYPNPVIQRPYQTHLKVTTLPETFCKYDREPKHFSQMRGTFPGYGRAGQASHEQPIEEQELGVYKYYIACITLAELGPATTNISFEVKAGVAFAITSNTPEYSETTNIVIALQTNKDALCYYSTIPESIGSLIGNESGSQSHVAAATGGIGKNDYYIVCATTGRAVINGTPESAKLNLTVYAVDRPANITLAEPGACMNGFLDGDESDADCGGSCQSRCGENRKCSSDTDCFAGLSCIENPMAGFRICAGAELIRQLERLRDSDRDGLPDWWEERYFGNITAAEPNADTDKDGLTNLEEYQYYEKTGKELDPKKADSDGDGWNDKDEIIKGYDPTDANIYPPSTWWMWLIIILLIAILLLVTGYITYSLIKRREEEREREKKREMEKKEAELKKVERKEKITTGFDRVKKIFAKKEDEYPLISDISMKYAKKAMTGEERAKEIFGKLKNFLEGKPIERLERGEAIEKLRKLQKGREIIAEPFAALIKLAVDRYPRRERMELLRKLQLLRAGLLSEDERRELFEKLREIAKYWMTHKELLRKEIERWLAKKPFVFDMKKKDEK